VRGLTKSQGKVRELFWSGKLHNLNLNYLN